MKRTKLQAQVTKRLAAKLAPCLISEGFTILRSTCPEPKRRPGCFRVEVPSLDHADCLAEIDGHGSSHLGESIERVGLYPSS